MTYTRVSRGARIKVKAPPRSPSASPTGAISKRVTFLAAAYEARRMVSRQHARSVAATRGRGFPLPLPLPWSCVLAKSLLIHSAGSTNIHSLK
jgi:hypothetical protein